VWSDQIFEKHTPVDYLLEGESIVNRFEELIASAAPRIYDELLDPPPQDRRLREFLTAAPNRRAAVVFDGLSIREMPMLRQLARESGFAVRTQGFGRSAIPSETLDFVDQALRVGRVAPSQLPGRRELKEARIVSRYLSAVTQRQTIEPTDDAILLWSAFPDVTYKDSGARFKEHFDVIRQQLETAWQNTVQTLPQDREILITSDHGYLFLDAGLAFARKNTELSALNDYFGSGRSHSTDDAPPPAHPDIVVVDRRRVAVIRGRVQTHARGAASALLYRHGGLSLMEVLTPWLVLARP